MAEFIVIIGALIGAAVGLHQLWAHLLAPRTQRYKLQGAFALIQQWFDQIDASLEHGVDHPRLNNLEARISRYLKDQGIDQYQLKFTPAFQCRFLRHCGIREEFHNQKLFEMYARCPASGIDLGSFWQLLVGAFSGFHAAYTSGRSETNFADVEMRVTLLRMYLNVKEA